VRLLSLLRLETKVLLIQVGIVLLVGGLVFGTIVSVLERVVEEQ